MSTYTAEISVGGPYYGSPFSAHVKCDAPGWTAEFGESSVQGSGKTPEEAATNARRHVAAIAERDNIPISVCFGCEN